MDLSDHDDPEDDTTTESLTPRGSVGGDSCGKPRYRECLKNHAVTIGGDAVDGCGEFMPAGGEGTIDSLRCAACNCHRNFHRKELPGSSSSSIVPFQDHNLHAQLPRGPYCRTPAGCLHYAAGGGGGPHGYGRFRPLHGLHPASPLALPSTSGGREEEEMSEDLPMQEGRLMSAGGGAEGSSGGKRRFRTKFTQEQKVRMLEFAEKVGWRIQKHDEAAVFDLCNETGVKRHVLKVWMHNNKHTLGKKVLPS